MLFQEYWQNRKEDKLQGKYVLYKKTLTAI